MVSRHRRQTGTFAVNGGTAKLTKNDDDTNNIASISTTDGKTAYRTELTGQTGVASVLVDGVNQGITYNHPDSDTSLYLYLVHDDSDNITGNHAVVVMYQDGSRKEYTATWGGSEFTFNIGSTSTPTGNSSIDLDLSGANPTTGKAENAFGDTVPVVITVNLTAGQTNNALLPSNGPMMAAANSLPYAFKTVILPCNGEEIQRKDVPETQTSVVFYVQTQAWTPGEYKFTPAYGGDASTGNSAIAETDAQTLNIVGQTLDEDTLTWNDVAVSGTYGQKVSELTASGTVTQNGVEIPGTWTTSGDAALDVDTTQAVTVTLTATSYTYDNANVGTGKTITASGITLIGTDANNYTLASNTAATTGSVTSSATAAVPKATPSVQVTAAMSGSTGARLPRGLSPSRTITD